MLFKPLRHFLPHRHSLQCIRTFVDDIDIEYIRDRGLDHAVEKEKDLKSLINLKNLIKLEPSKSLPLSSIVDSKEKLGISFRPIEFIRKYPTVFEEYFPANIGIHPHVRLSSKIISLDAEEQLIYDSDVVRKGAADRLLKLLMLCRINEIPLKLIDGLKWDLGLPDNYEKTLVSEFPDYFKVRRMKNSSEGFLELVCWSDELSVSVMEKKALKGGSGFQKGMPLSFPMQFSTGFEMDKKLKKWISEWQKLPYTSPYEDSTRLQPNSDESDKWAVSVLHEFLNILVPKKTDRENILTFGEYLGIRARFKRALVHHPGIFYLSSKNGTYTVVLREGYKRGLLIENHPLMEMRNKYTHLMHTVKVTKKQKNVLSSDASKKKEVKETIGKEKQQEGDEKEKDEGTRVSESDESDESDVEDESIDDGEVEREEDNKSPRGRRGERRRGSSITTNVGRRKKGRAGRGVGRERSPREYLSKN